MMGVVNERIIFSLDLEESKIVIPISSFTAQIYNGRPSFMSATIPDFRPYIDDIRSRMDGGTMMLEKSINGNVEEIFWAYIENAAIEETGSDKRLVVSGYRTFCNSDPKTVSLVDVEYKRKSNPAAEPALRTLRCSIMNSVLPGDTVKYDDYEFVASQVVISGYGNRLAMELKEVGQGFTTGIFYPAVSADDYFWVDVYFFNDYSVSYIGNWYGACNMGVCFKSVEIPQGATVTSAFVAFVVYDSWGFSVDVNIHGNDVDNASPPASIAEAEALVLTDAIRSWSNVPKYPDGYECITPDISNIVQEIVDREGWAPGNSLQLLFKDNGSGEYTYRQFKAIDAGINYRPKLQVTWES